MTTKLVGVEGLFSASLINKIVKLFVSPFPSHVRLHIREKIKNTQYILGHVVPVYVLICRAQFLQYTNF
mgnify:CR=1 FL=1